MYMRYCGIIVGETYRTYLSFHLEAMSQFKHKSKVRKLRICTIGHRYQAVPILQTVIRVTVYNDCQKAHQMKSVTDHTEIIKGVRLIPIKFSP